MNLPRINLFMILLTSLSLALFAATIHASPISNNKVANIVANTCIGKMRLDILPPLGGKLYWRSTLKLKNGETVTGFFTQQVDGPVDTNKRLQKTYPSFEAELVQQRMHNFKLKKSKRPDCDIEIIDYGVLVPETKQSNLYGHLVVPLILVLDDNSNPEDDYAWGQETPEVEGENWKWDVVMHPIDSVMKIGEVLAGGNNPWANPPAEEKPKKDGTQDSDGDGYADADYNRDGQVSDTEKEMYAFEPVRNWFRWGGLIK